MTRNIYESWTVHQTYSVVVGFSQLYVVLISVVVVAPVAPLYDSV
jgi:hypothetical protein